MLMDMLGKAVDSVDDLSAVVGPLQDLAVRHLEYGTLEAHYPVVGECLLWTLEQGLGKAWNDELKQTWLAVYTIVSQVMTDAAKKAQSEKKQPAKEEGLSSKQRQLIKESWAKVVPIREKAAKMFYDRLFEVAPSVKPLFSETNMKKQGLMLMDMLGKAVDSVDDLSAVVGPLQDLAVRHLEYGTTAEHYPVVGACLLWTLEQGLGKAWNDEVKEAWTAVYGIVSKVMLEAAQKSKKELSREELIKKPLSEKQIKLIKDSWAKVTPLQEEAGKKFYDHLFQTHPETKALFQESRMRTQAIMLMDILNKCVQTVEDLSQVKKALADTGKRHANFYKTEEDHYPVVGGNLLWFVRDGVGEANWTTELQEAWEIAYAHISTIMIEGARA